MFKLKFFQFKNLKYFPALATENFFNNYFFKNFKNFFQNCCPLYDADASENM